MAGHCRLFEEESFELMARMAGRKRQFDGLPPGLTQAVTDRGIVEQVGKDQCKGFRFLRRC